MAEILARSLFAEIEEESLDSFLLSLQTRCFPPTTSPLRIATLDTLLGPFLTTKTSRSTIPRPAQKVPSDPSAQLDPRAPLAPHVAPKPPLPPVIEIVGLGPCSGKTQLLHRCAAEFLVGISPDRGDQSTDREGSSVLWLDTDARFSVLRLHRQIKTLVRAGERNTPTHPRDDKGWREARNDGEAVPDDEDNDGPTNSHADSRSILDNLYHYNIADFSSLLTTLDSLPEKFLQRQPPQIQRNEDKDSSRRVAALILGNASAFLWDERRHAAEVTATGNEGAGMMPTTAATAQQRANAVIAARYAALATILRRVQTRLGCVVVTSNWSFAQAPFAESWEAKGTGLQKESMLAQHLPGSWGRFVDARVFVWRERVRRKDGVYGNAVGMDEILRHHTEEERLRLLVEDAETEDEKETARMSLMMRHRTSDEDADRRVDEILEKRRRRVGQMKAFHGCVHSGGDGGATVKEGGRFSFFVADQRLWFENERI